MKQKETLANYSKEWLLLLDKTLPLGITSEQVKTILLSRNKILNKTAGKGDD